MVSSPHSTHITRAFRALSAAPNACGLCAAPCSAHRLRIHAVNLQTHHVGGVVRVRDRNFEGPARCGEGVGGAVVLRRAERPAVDQQRDAEAATHRDGSGGDRAPCWQ